MARKARAETETGLFHVYARGNNRQNIFADGSDRRRYLLLLGQAVKRCNWYALGYCLMPNHIHLLIETTKPNLHVGMGRLHSAYAQAFNHRHQRSGHLFQGRYGSTPVSSNEQLVTVVRYIALNPVAAGLARSASDWLWSSHRAVAGQEDPPPWLAVGRLTDLLEGWSGSRSAYAELTQT